MVQQFRDEELKMATEITIAALQGSGSGWTNAPDKVATFFEIVAKKIHDLANIGA